MPEIKIYGASDDLVEVKGCPGADEFGSYERGLMWWGDLVTADEVMRVTAVLSDEGCWSFALGQADASLPVPAWPVRVEGHPDIDHTAVLVISAPNGTRLTNTWPARAGGDDE